MNIIRDSKEHLEAVSETYFEHMCCALYFSIYMISIAVICFIHAFIPGIFRYTSSDHIGRLYSQMTTYRIK
jgi:hypothetical protein